MQPRLDSGRPLPLVTPVSQPYFDAAREGRLLLQKCPRDGFFFYSRERCPHCLGSDWQWQESRKQGVVYSLTVDYFGQEPGLRRLVPFSIAVVGLLDGPRVIGNICDQEPANMAIGSAVNIYFEQLEDVALLYFRSA